MLEKLTLVVFFGIFNVEERMMTEFQPKEREIALAERLIADGNFDRVRQTDREVSNGEWLFMQARMSRDGGGADHLR